MASRPQLGVWLYGVRVAKLQSTKIGAVELRYTPEALDRWAGGTPLLSCSLPLTTAKHRHAERFFRGLLPEGRALEAMAAVAGAPTYDTYALLARFGRDVAGAVVISVDEPAEHPGDVAHYDADELAAEVAGLDDRPLGLYDDSELSLAGLQNKMLLVRVGDEWARPIGGRPSTHILKVEDRRYPGLAAGEAACLHLARELGLTTVEASVERFDDIDCLIVSRFDRSVVDGEVARIHQEDACQALGRDAETNRRKGKYERAGGPTLREVAALLDRHAREPLAQLHQLVRFVTFTVTIGNADAHGKNVSLLHTAPGVVELAPAYDTVPTMCWPRLPGGAAMSIGGQTTLAHVTLGDIAEEGRRWSLPAEEVADLASATVEQIRGALARIAMPDALAELITARSDALTG